MLNPDVAGKVIHVGPHFLEPKGGIAQVLHYYRKHIFGPDTVFIENSDSRGKVVNVWKFAHGYAGLYKACLDKSVEFVHIHTASRISFRRSCVFASLARRMGKKVIMHIHGGGFRDYYAEAPAYVTRQLAACHALVVLSESWRKFFREIGANERIFVVNNIIERPAAAMPDRHALPLHAICLGLVADAKGTFDLVRAVGLRKDSLVGKLRLHIGGNGDTERLQRMIAELGVGDIVCYEGWVSGDRKAALLADASITVLPSYAEGVPLTILEALAYGHAVVSTPVGGIPEVVDTSDSVLLTPGDIEGLADTLVALVSSPDTVRRMGESSLRNAADFFPNAVARQLEVVYASL